MFTYTIKHAGAISLNGGFYSESRLPQHIDDVNCNGTEMSIFNCSYNTMTNYYCSNYYDAGVICQRKLYKERACFALLVCSLLPHLIEHCDYDSLRLTIQ